MGTVTRCPGTPIRCLVAAMRSSSGLADAFPTAPPAGLGVDVVHRRRFVHVSDGAAGRALRRLPVVVPDENADPSTVLRRAIAASEAAYKAGLLAAGAPAVAPAPGRAAAGGPGSLWRVGPDGFVAVVDGDLGTVALAWRSERGPR